MSIWKDQHVTLWYSKDVRTVRALLSPFRGRVQLHAEPMRGLLAPLHSAAVPEDIHDNTTCSSNGSAHTALVACCSFVCGLPVGLFTAS